MRYSLEHLKIPDNEYMKAMNTVQYSVSHQYACLKFMMNAFVQKQIFTKIEQVHGQVHTEDNGL